MLPTLVQAQMAQRMPEFKTWLALCLSLGIKSYVELGSGSGHFLRRAGVERVLCIDLAHSSVRHNPYEANDVTYLRGDSRSLATRQLALDVLGCHPDAVFVDADHDGEAPFEDYAMWWPVTQVVMGFHDILMPSVAPIWRRVNFDTPSVSIVGHDLASAQAWQGMGTSPDGRISGGGIGVLFKEP